MEGERCVSNVATGKRKGQRCLNPAASGGNVCGVHARGRKPGRGVLDWLVTLVSGTTNAVNDHDDEDTMSAEAGVENVANDNNNNAPPPPPKRVYATTGCGKARFVGVVSVDNKTYVCNVKGSSKDKGSWKTFCARHLKAEANEEYPKVCRVKDCQRKVTATGHMYWRDCKGTPDGRRYNYLVGICSHHNSSVYDDKYVPLKKGFAVQIEENPIVAVSSGRNKTKSR